MMCCDDNIMLHDERLHQNSSLYLHRYQQVVHAREQIIYLSLLNLSHSLMDVKLKRCQATICTFPEGVLVVDACITK